MGAILDFITSKTGIVAILGAGLLLLFGVQEVRLKLAQSGEAHARADLASLEATVSAANARAQAQATQAAAISQTAASGLQNAKAAIVTRYVTLKGQAAALGDVDCKPPAGWVALWNAGATP